MLSTWKECVHLRKAALYLLLAMIILIMYGKFSISDSPLAVFFIILLFVFIFLFFRAMWKNDKSESKDDIILMEIRRAEIDTNSLNTLLENGVIDQQEYAIRKQKIDLTLEKHKKSYHKHWYIIKQVLKNVNLKSP